MPNFSQGKIYMIWSPHTEKIYVGSTTQSLSSRFSAHKGKTRCSSKEIMEFPETKIELIEEYPCENKKELNKREGEVIRENKDKCVNKRIAGRTTKEFLKEYQQTQEYKDYQKNYRERNKDYYASYRSRNSDKNKEYQKAWRTANTDYFKDYYQRKKAQKTLN